MAINYRNAEFTIVYFNEGTQDDPSVLTRLGVTAEDRNEDGLNVLHITNKYFDTDVHICRCNVEEFIKNFSCFTKMEALLYVFEDKESVFEEVQKTSKLFTGDNGPELRMAWESSKKVLNDDFKDDYFSWCLENQFELVENPEETEDEEEEEDAFKVKYGLDRIKEALASHMWTNHSLKGGEISGAVGGPSFDKDEALPPNNDAFEDLFGKLQTMKDQAMQLDGEDRKEYAEKVAFAFMEALGINDDDDNDEAGREVGDR